jgi:hypothetical protein
MGRIAPFVRAGLCGRKPGAGPNTPAAPAAALIRALLDGREFATGARPCVGMLNLDMILRELEHLPVGTRVDRALPQSPILFERLLGPDWEAMAEAVRVVHGGGRIRASGRAVARAGKSLVARGARFVLGLPRSGRHAVSVSIDTDASGGNLDAAFRNFALFVTAHR